VPVEFGIFQDVMESSTLAMRFAILLQLDIKCFVCLYFGVALQLLLAV